MKFVKLCKMLWNTDDWEIENYHTLLVYNHKSGYHTYVGYCYFKDGSCYEPPMILDTVIELLFCRLQNKLENRMVA
jgi:hypothetical protein